MIAFCFLITHDFPQEEIWKAYFERIETNSFKIIIHSKHDAKFIPYFTPFAIPSLNTRWGTFSIVHAQNAMLKEALKDEKVKYMCLLSGDSIPLKSFDWLQRFLNTHDSSHFTLFNPNTKFPRNNMLKMFTSDDNITPQQQWCIIRRNHAETITTKEEEYAKYFRCVHAPDEVTYYTILKHYNNKNNIRTYSGSVNSIMFTHWHDIYYRYKIPNENLGTHHPKTYQTIRFEELKYLTEQPTLCFARKFARDCTVDNNSENQSLFQIIDLLK
jgi:hypothetical protein